MIDLKMQLQQSLIANIIIDKCSTNKNILFKESWCSHERVVRFVTPFLRELFQVKESLKGYWKTGDTAMYEVYISQNALSVKCVICNINTQNKEIFDILKLFPNYSIIDKDLFSVGQWDFKSNNKIDTLFVDFEMFLKKDLKQFEQELSSFIAEESQKRFLEGEKLLYYAKKYERNPKARAACIAYYGAMCNICGIDFGKTYGPEFADKIEVHHIIPISQIGEEYVVDPIKDLIPVCPNCHTTIHSKNNGFYTVEEVKKLISK